MAKGQLYCLKSYLGTGLIPIAVMGPTYEIFRNPKEQQEHPWRSQCVDECNGQEATLSLVIPYFSNPKVVMEPTFGELMTQQAHSWGKAFI